MSNWEISWNNEHALIWECKCLNLILGMPCFCIFGLEFQKTIAIFEISTLEFVKLQNFVEKWKCLNLVPKMPYLRIFGLEFENNLSYLISAPSNLSNRKTSRKNKNCQNWDQKCLIWVFLGWNLMSYLKSTPSNLSNCKISGKNIKMVKFVSKSALFRCFWARIWK